jgi:signal transduction histidine kinase
VSNNRDDASLTRYRLTGGRRIVRTIAKRVRPRRIGLRNRILIIFGAGSMILAGVLATTTYSFTRSSLMQQRENAEINLAFSNARRVQNELLSNRSAVNVALSQVGDTHRLLYMDGKWTSTNSLFNENSIPLALKQQVMNQRTAAMMTAPVRDWQVLIVGIRLDRINAAYFEFDNLREVRQALRSVQIALFFSAFITILVGFALGLFASRRAVRPLANAAQAARAIADGSLNTRLEPTDDPDMQVLTSAFNDMVSTMQQRVERDARFTSDVSHELRSPLMTLAASVQVMESRRDELSERSQAALDLLIGDVVRFQGLVEDLLEISRFDAGAIRLVQEPLVLHEFVRQAISVSSLPRTEVRVLSGVETATIRGDKRRLARVIANLIDNARIHSGGRPTVLVQFADEDEPISNVWIVVEDNGEGLIDGEVAKIFERFSRGAAAGKRTGQEGAGLGLALALEHITLHGGRIWAENRTDGIVGARFIVELPVETTA